MSFVDIRTYFQDRMAAVSPDLREWEDAFNIENIPSTILDKAWHIGFGSFSYTGTAHSCLGFSCPITISVIIKGYRTPKDAIDSALILANDIVKECTKPLNRLNQVNIKNVLPNSIAVRPQFQDNDNNAVLELNFNCDFFIGF